MKHQYPDYPGLSGRIPDTNEYPDYPGYPLMGILPPDSHGATRRGVSTIRCPDTVRASGTGGKPALRAHVLAAATDSPHPARVKPQLRGLVRFLANPRGLQSSSDARSTEPQHAPKVPTLRRFSGCTCETPAGLEEVAHDA